MTSRSSYSVMVFSWNTESISLCETMDIEKSIKNRKSVSSFIPGLTTWRYPCDIPDFFPKFADFIINSDVDIVVVGFQEDRHPGSYFHSHLLIEEMPKLGYELIKRTKLMGVGVTSYKGMLKGDPFERGLRVSIYAKNNIASIIEKEETEMRKIIGNKGQSSYICSSNITKGKGATVSYLMLPGFGRLAFICCHLPFNARSLISERLYDNKMLRQNELNYSNICFNNIIEQLVLFKNPIPTYVIYFGDFNYRISNYRLASEIANDFISHREDTEYIHNMYMLYDELRQQMQKQNIYEFLEGVSNSGPIFLPTCKMVKGRKETDKEYYNENKGTYVWKTGQQDQRVPSWCDRILYNKFGNDDRNIICTYYDRFETGKVMTKSDHAGIIGIFNLY